LLLLLLLLLFIGVFECKQCCCSLNTVIKLYASMKLLQHTYTQPFYGSLYYVQDNPGEPVQEGTFHHLLDFLEQNEDKTGRRTNNLDGLPPHPD